MRNRKFSIILMLILLVLQNTACENTNLQSETTETKIESNEKLLDNMHYVLPTDLTSGEFDLFLGGGGGIPLLKADTLSETVLYGGVELQLDIDGIFEDGELIGVNSFSNHSSFSEFTSFPSSVPCVTVLYSYDIYDEDVSEFIGEGNLWYAFWAVEGMSPVYALFLNADYFDYEDLAAIAETVTFSEGAFVVKEVASTSAHPNSTPNSNIMNS